MSRQDLNKAFANTSFLHGANASYIEEQHARYQENPGSVPEEWRNFFANLHDNPESITSEAEGPSWAPHNLNEDAANETTAALTGGDWGTVETGLQNQIRTHAQSVGGDVSPAATMRATQDSVRALMLIRSYRVRGHLLADLDPLGLQERDDHP